MERKGRNPVEFNKNIFKCSAITPQAAADYLGVSRMTIMNCINNGLLKATKEPQKYSKITGKDFGRFLDKYGYGVSTARDGFEALDKIKEHNYDMLILDLKMPRIGGMELLANLKGLKKELIVIVITAYAAVDTAKTAIQQGCFDYIAKPFEMEEVGAVIKRAFEMRSLAEEKKKRNRADFYLGIIHTDYNDSEYCGVK